MALVRVAPGAEANADSGDLAVDARFSQNFRCIDEHDRVLVDAGTTLRERLHQVNFAQGGVLIL